MKKEPRGLLLLAAGGMELSWRYAWANFLTLAVLSHPFPFPEAVVGFAAASALTLFSKGTGWRMVYKLGLQAFGLVFSALRVVYVFYAWSSPFLSRDWLIECLNAPRSPLDWINLILILLLALMFWIGGVTLARRPIAYSRICSRFDLGVAAFFLLLLIRFGLLVKGGIETEAPFFSLLIFSFFVFSLLAIGLVRNRMTPSRDFLPGYQGVGVILSFTVVVFLVGAGLVAFFLPYLTLAAETGYDLLKTAATPLGPVLVSILRFILMGVAIRPEHSSSSAKETTGGSTAPVESSGWLEFFGRILSWAFVALLGLIVLAAAAVGLYFLFRWLLSRTPVSRERQSAWSPWSMISGWAERLRRLLVSCWKWIQSKAKGPRGAAQLYAALLRWGGRSGLPHLLSETPLEYGLRLKNRFPALKGEIGFIIEAFNRQVYAETILSERQWGEAKSAWRRLRSPLHWPSRLKSWLPQASRLSA